MTKIALMKQKKDGLDGVRICLHLMSRCSLTVATKHINFLCAHDKTQLYVVSKQYPTNDLKQNIQNVCPHLEIWKVQFFGMKGTFVNCAKLIQHVLTAQTLRVSTNPWRPVHQKNQNCCHAANVWNSSDWFYKIFYWKGRHSLSFN